MSNATRKPTLRRNIRPQNTTNDLTLAPSPFLPISIASNSTNNIEHESTNTSQEQQQKKEKQKKKIEDLEDQVVPQAQRGTKHPVIEHNRFDDYYRSRLDAPIFRYTSNKNNNNNSNHNEDRRTSPTNSNGNQNNPIVVE